MLLNNIVSFEKPGSELVGYMCELNQLLYAWCGIMMLGLYFVDWFSKRHLVILNRQSVFLKRISLHVCTCWDVQSNFNGSNTFGTMKISLRQG